MKLTFLGTGAAEGYPALWCRCERCTTARQRGGRNLRFRSSLLVNDDLLIDPGPDMVAAAVRHGLDLAPVQAALVTHPHTDHLEGSTFFWRRKGFVGTPLPWLDLYASRFAIERISRHEGRVVDPAEVHARVHPISAFQRFRILTGHAEPDSRFPDSPDGVPDSPGRAYDVWTFRASHAEPAMEPMLFAVRQVAGPEHMEGRPAATLLYATDTGPFGDDTWEALERLGREDGVRFTGVAIDSTLGLGADGSGHMSLSQMTAHHDQLAGRGLVAEHAPRIAHHFSHNGTPPYEELVEHLAPQRVLAAYDGLVLDV